MSDLALHHRRRRFANKVRVLGLKEALRSVRGLFRAKKQQAFPLAGAHPDLVFASSVEAIRDYARRERGKLSKKDVNKDLSSHFPYTYLHPDGMSMRYAFFPSAEQSKGLVVVFHGYLGFEIYPIRYGWKHFDVLLPYDNFGWRQLGSWFWGANGSDYVAQVTRGLIDKVRSERKALRWFTTGSSMGGFAALYHGISHTSDGIYVMTPIINLKGKIADYRARNIETSYTAVADSNDVSLQHVPDIYQVAGNAETLPPLFLIQNQYDRSNPFGSDTMPLLQLYNQKKGWLGLRVQPAIGHQGHDGSYDEAQYFFDLIATKSPPRVVDFYTQDEGS